jgi:uncharacterized membrane protein YfcA
LQSFLTAFRKQIIYFYLYIINLRIFWQNYKGMKKVLRVSLYVVVALVIGLINGFFGGGGGMLLVPLLTHVAMLPEKKAHATAIPIILPISIASGITYIINGVFSFSSFIPIVICVVAGGIVGALLLKKLPPFITSVTFAILMIIAGVKLCL